MNIYQTIVRRFPPSIVYSFAYGSGVKKQLGYENVKKPVVIDLIFCVENARKWHAANYELHPSHYSALRNLGSGFIASYQENLGAKVYFNTLVPIPELGVTVKYGVVSRNDLVEDLTDWEHLYLAGRLHKPVTQVVPSADEALKSALERNLHSAFTTALLLLPEQFSDFELFHKISSLSYKGDFRMIFGENKNKVRNIVEAQLDGFFQLYHPTLRKLSYHVALGTDRKGGKLFEQDKSVQAVERHLHALPKNLQNSIVTNSAGHGQHYGEIVAKIAGDQSLPNLVTMSVDDIVWRSSVWQSVKNIPSAGLLKSIVYSWRKAAKTFAN